MTVRNNISTFAVWKEESDNFLSIPNSESIFLEELKIASVTATCSSAMLSV